MPYILKTNRRFLDAAVLEAHGALANADHTPGNLNYLLTRIADDYLSFDAHGAGYADYNEVIGVLECVKQELYRRVGAPYEDAKMRLNGDVYDQRRGHLPEIDTAYHPALD